MSLLEYTLENIFNIYLYTKNVFSLVLRLRRNFRILMNDESKHTIYEDKFSLRAFCWEVCVNVGICIVPQHR